MLTSHDLLHAHQLDYKFNIEDSRALIVLNTHFEGIALTKLLDDFSNLFDPFAERPLDNDIIIKDPPPYFEIFFRSENYWDEDKGLYLSRVFKRLSGKLIVEHKYLVLPKAARGMGIGKKVIAACLDQYLTMNVEAIYVHAGLADGGAVWAKLGFKALNKWEMESILKEAEVRLAGKPALNLVQAIFNEYYSNEPKGISLPIEDWVNIPAMISVLKLPANNWHGWIDLTNPNELFNFKSNVGR
jgi:GNAT superfamily N-acetyltransferase